MFKKLLIANRSEIACRIIRAAKKLGIVSVAVYSEIDKDALHVKMSDEAYLIGPAPLKDSYLNIDNILKVAREAHVDAVHPGYGFLSENAEFTKRVEEANLIFIGPPASAILAMASKKTAKDLVSKAGVPIIPGFESLPPEGEDIEKKASEIGFPLLIKASYGGGGKGMRIVHKLEEFKEALLACQREAKSSFGNDEVILEKYLKNPRHIEVQIFADSKGNCVHLFERDCSIQRRHQKIVEEAPGFNLDEALRSKLGETAIAAAKAVGYQNAGTVEFLLDENHEFYFMEMNTRLQVEHPVTEMITDLDLVEWQFKIANGEPIPLKQSEIKHHGAAIEARIYAEDPAQDFLPATGKIKWLCLPKNINIRVDIGVEMGDTITIYYDPMIGKLIVLGNDRKEAIQNMQYALDNFHIVGVANNLSFLRTLIRHPDYIKGKVHTHFIQNHFEKLFKDYKSIINYKNLDKKHYPYSQSILCAAFLFYKECREERAKKEALQNNEPNSPWYHLDHWRLFGAGIEMISLVISPEDKEYQFSYSYKDNHLTLPDGNIIIPILKKMEKDIQNYSYKILIELEKKEYLFTAYHSNSSGSFGSSGSSDSSQNIYYLYSHSENRELFFSLIQETHKSQSKDHEHKLSSPMPGTITQLMVSPGKKVKAGEPLLILEAMKMEHTVKAPYDGIIKELYYQLGDMVNPDTELLALESTPSSKEEII